jgi:hypothetical protein
MSELSNPLTGTKGEHGSGREAIYHTEVSEA